jgi:seryl-tRNA synthetase
MLDINFIRENPEKVKIGVTKKGYPGTIVDQLLEIDQNYRTLVRDVDNLRAERNNAASSRDIEKGKEVKVRLSELEIQLEEIRSIFHQKLSEIPNLPSDNVPPGAGEQDNVFLREVGQKPNFTFTPKDHVELAEKLEIIDFERGSKIAGSGFYYLKNEGALLELALVQYGMNFLQQKGFIPIITPDLARERFYLGTGYLPKGLEAQTYIIENSDLGLVATAEVTLAGLHADEVFDPEQLPKKYAGYSHCFRMEAGGYGKYSKGLYRVHQFTKVEMFVDCNPSDSEEIHQKLLELEEEFWKSLEVPYRVLQMCTGDLGAQAVEKYDLEAWMCGRGEWGEVTSTSNTTDYQSRRLGIKFKTEQGSNFVHTLNGTLVATSRAIIAILENFQQEDGSIKIPEALQKYTGFSEIVPKK